MKPTYPPFIVLGLILLQLLLLYLIPLYMNFTLLIGLVLLLASVSIIAYSFKELNKFETTYIPDGEPVKLVTSGPFKYSRHPIYGGMAGILFAVALLMQSLSAILVPFLFILLINNTWIPHEESKLEETFGKDWKSYSDKTKRCLFFN